MQMSIRELCNMPGVPETAVVPVRDRIAELPDTAYMTVNPHYYFDETLLKKMLRYFLMVPSRNNAMFIGDSGVGKSSLVEQICARLGWPVFSLACSGKMRLSNFVGTFALIDGETVWQDGPLVMAMRTGGLFLADEITRLDHSEQMGLAKVLDQGARITIPETGEVVQAHPSFRFCCTGNSGGYGDESGAYNGERVSSVAFLDRFQKFQVNYMPEQAEVALLKASVEAKAPNAGIPDWLFSSMVKLANDVRKNFVGRGGDLRTIISTRSLVVWALEIYSYQDICGAPVEEALNDTVLNGAPDHDRSVISELWGKWISQAA